MRPTDSHKRPLPPGQRILFLDALRGLAIFGILLANLLIFAFPSAPSTPSLHSISTPAQVSASHSFANVFLFFWVEGKFYTLFSLLFGMGLALQYQRAQVSGISFIPIHLRRMGLLFVTGSLHGVFLFSADILGFYALVGIAALPFLKFSPRALLTAAIVLFIIGLLVFGTYIGYFPQNPNAAPPSWEKLAADYQRNGRVADSTHILMPLWKKIFAFLQLDEKEFYCLMASESRIYRQGPWLDTLLHRGFVYFCMGMPLKLLLTGWRVLAFFLLGIYWIKREYFINKEKNQKDFYNRLIGAGLFGGLLLQSLGGFIVTLPHQSTVLHITAITAILTGTFVLSTGYAGIMGRLCQSTGKGLLNFLDLLAAVGRTSLSNYLLQSVICGFLFYHWGLRLFDSFGLSTIVVMAVPIFCLQVLLSKIWLRYFNYGPMEWLWRGLSYGNFSPLLKKH